MQRSGEGAVGMLKVLASLGLARRAGKLRYGYDTVAEALRGGECPLVLVTEDLSDKTKKNVRFEAERAKAAFFETAVTMEQISAAIGKRTGVLAVCDAGFARKMKQALEAAGESEKREGVCASDKDR